MDEKKIKELHKRAAVNTSSKDYDIAKTLGTLVAQGNSLQISMENHLSNHRKSDVLMGMYFALTMLSFCFLKWGG